MKVVIFRDEYSCLPNEASFFSIINRNNYGYDIVIDLEEVYQIMLNKKVLPCRKEIIKGFSNCVYDIIQTQSLKIKDFSIDTQDSLVGDVFDFYNLLNDAAKSDLYKFQLENIKWMINTKNNKIITKQDKDRFFNIHKDMFFDNKTKNIFIGSVPDNKLYYDNLIKGACLVEEDELNTQISIIGYLSVVKNDKPVLIITENQTISQWEDQVKKYTNYNVLSIKNNKDFSEYSLNDIKQNNIIITSWAFLSSALYSRSVASYSNKTCVKDYIREMKTMIDQVELEDNSVRVPLNMIEWGEIIIQNHDKELLLKNIKYVLSLECDFRWVIPNKPPFQLREYIGLMFDIFEPSYSQIPPESFWRKNTKKSLSREFKLPKINYETIFLNMSQKERNIYTNLKNNIHEFYMRDEIIKMCSFPRLYEHETLTIKTNDNEENIKKMIIEKNEALLKNVKKDFDIVTNENTRNMLSNKIRLYSDRSRFLNNISIGSEDFKCPFCYEIKNEPVITQCGHIYCEECCIQMIRSTDCCGICRQHLCITDLIKLKKTKDDIVIDFVYGTKIDALIKYISQTSISEKIILFSSWTTASSILQSYFKESGIRSFVYKGSFAQKDKVIKTFKQSAKRCVIILSPENSALGVDLIESNMILFLDNYCKKGSEEEKQIISRTARIGQKKDIIVKRFIMKDTEEDT